MHILSIKVFRFRSEYDSDTLSKEWGTSIKTHNYTWPGSCIKTALSQATATSPGLGNWGVVYPTVKLPQRPLDLKVSFCAVRTELEHENGQPNLIVYLNLFLRASLGME